MKFSNRLNGDSESFYAFGIPQYQQQQHHRSPFKHVLKMVNTKRKRKKNVWFVSAFWFWIFFFFFWYSVCCCCFLTVILVFRDGIGCVECRHFSSRSNKGNQLKWYIYILYTFCTYNHLLTNNRTKCSKMIVNPLLYV